MKFKKVIGNELIKKQIYKYFDNPKHFHAFIFSGAKNSGKFDFIKELSSNLLNKKNLHSPYITIVDDLYIDGVGKEKKGDSNFNQSHRKILKKKSNVIGIDDIEVITKNLYETIDGKYKILCIRDIERLTVPASNKLLKILEEPPQKTLFLFSTSNKQKVLPTVYSRCIIECFYFLSNSDMNKYFSLSTEKISKRDKDFILLFSGGRNVIFQKMLEDRHYLENTRKLYENNMKIILSTDLEKIKYAESYSKKTLDEIIEFLSIYFFIFRDFIKHNYKIIEIIDTLDFVKENILLNGNKRLLLEKLFLSFDENIKIILKK
jgi:hypothetical protein